MSPTSYQTAPPRTLNLAQRSIRVNLYQNGAKTQNYRMLENGSGRRIALLMFDTISPSLTPGSFFILFHSGLRARRRPRLITGRHIIECEHVGELRQVSAGERFSKEHRLHSEFTKKCNLTFFKHADLSRQRSLVVGFVGSQFENVRLGSELGDRKLDSGIGRKAAKHNDLLPNIWKARAVEALARLYKFFVFAKLSDPRSPKSTHPHIRSASTVDGLPSPIRYVKAPTCFAPARCSAGMIRFGQIIVGPLRHRVLCVAHSNIDNSRIDGLRFSGEYRPGSMRTILLLKQPGTVCDSY